MNTYTCKECGASCTNNKQSTQKGTVTLGTWRCPRHGKTKVKRSKATPKEN